MRPLGVETKKRVLNMFESMYFFRTRTLSCTYSSRNVEPPPEPEPPEPEIPPESRFVRVRRLTKEHIQAMQENPITFHCCPPEGNLARLLTLVFATLAILVAAEAVLGHRAAPGGNIFALLILILFALIGGVIIRLVDVVVYKCCKIDLRLPALLGMLVVGILLKNLPYNINELGQPECTEYNLTK